MLISQLVQEFSTSVVWLIGISGMVCMCITGGPFLVGPLGLKSYLHWHYSMIFQLTKTDSVP